MANAAEFERRQIGERTRVALAAKKARGARLGRPRRTPTELLGRVSREREAGRTWQAIADGLNADSAPTTRGGVRVARVIGAIRLPLAPARPRSGPPRKHSRGRRWLTAQQPSTPSSAGI